LQQEVSHPSVWNQTSSEIFFQQKNIPSDTTQRHKYLKTILFFSTYNNLQAKGKKTIILHQLQSFSNFRPE
jgi:hypothetical protein